MPMPESGRAATIRRLVSTKSRLNATPNAPQYRAINSANAPPAASVMAPHDLGRSLPPHDDDSATSATSPSDSSIASIALRDRENHRPAPFAPASASHKTARRFRSRSAIPSPRHTTMAKYDPA